jgi:hypothetical protein
MTTFLKRYTVLAEWHMMGKFRGSVTCNRKLANLLRFQHWIKRR